MDREKKEKQSQISGEFVPQTIIISLCILDFDVYKKIFFTYSLYVHTFIYI